MNFILWLLKRIKRTLIGDGQWEWISEYRRLILREKPMSFLVTVFGGLMWFMFNALLVIWLVDDKELGGNLMKGILISVPLFYVYNWLAALYEIYNTERMAVWDELKR